MNFDEPEIMVVAPPTPQSPHPDSLASVTALARFEFEPGKGNDGTKIMMVEWDDEDKSRDKAGTWQVSWQGKNTAFTADNSSDEVKRLYFLLPPGAIIPPHITISYRSPQEPSTDTRSVEEPLKMSVNPLPAIFTPELGATAKASGKKGVLHTIWAKKRLQSLEKEIKKEEETNLEGIALEMAVAEKEWIESNFGIGGIQKPPALDLSNITANTVNSPISPSLTSPKTPGGRRLTEKLRGLTIATTDKDLATKGGVNTPTRESHPLSPETGDMAYSSFSAFRDQPLSQQKQQQPLAKKVVAQPPPDFIRQQQSQASGASLDFMAANTTADTTNSQTDKEDADADADTEELFAVALSPRSPDDPKSPFSIPSTEASAFAKIKGSQS